MFEYRVFVIRELTGHSGNCLYLSNPIPLLIKYVIRKEGAIKCIVFCMINYGLLFPIGSICALNASGEGRCGFRVWKTLLRHGFCAVPSPVMFWGFQIFRFGQIFSSFFFSIPFEGFRGKFWFSVAGHPDCIMCRKFQRFWLGMRKKTLRKTERRERSPEVSFGRGRSRKFTESRGNVVSVCVRGCCEH